MFTYVMEGFEGEDLNEGNVFPGDFMKKFTKFSSFDELLRSGGLVINSKEDLEKIAVNELNTLIKNQSTFKSWEEMLETAIQEWTSRELGL
jgi:hypothetical protein